MKHKRAFYVKYIGPTNYKGARVSIKDLHNNKRKIIPYNSSLSAKESASTYLASIGIICNEFVFPLDTNWFLLLSDNFHVQLS